MSPTIHGGQLLRSFSVAAVNHDIQDPLNLLGRQPGLMPDHVAELLKDTLSLADLEFFSSEVQFIASSDQSDPERLSNGAKILIAAAEEQERFIAVFQVDRRLGHLANQQKATGEANKIESITSKIPPKPGRTSLASFRPKSRLIRDSAKSPSMAAIPIVTPKPISVPIPLSTGLRRLMPMVASTDVAKPPA